MSMTRCFAPLSNTIKWLFCSAALSEPRGGSDGETRLQNSRQRHACVRAPRSLPSLHESKVGRSDSTRPTEENPWADQVYFCRWPANTIFWYPGVGRHFAKKGFRGELPRRSRGGRALCQTAGAPLRRGLASAGNGRRGLGCGGVVSNFPSALR